MSTVHRNGAGVQVFRDGVSGASPAAVAYDDLSRFAQQVFSPLPRVDQRRWAEAYLRGLIGLKGKKSLRRIAEEVLALPATQSLQQFLNQSPWDWDPVRFLLAQYVSWCIRPSLLVLDRVYIAKRGNHSVGVERRYVPTEKKVVNCQTGVGLFLAADRLSVPVSWRIVLGRRWTQDAELRARAYIPDEFGAMGECEYMLDMVDQFAADWKYAPPPVAVDLREVNYAERMINGLSARGHKFVAEIDGTTAVIPASGPSGPRLVSPHGAAKARTMASGYLRHGSTRRHQMALSGSGLRVRHLQLLSAPVWVPAAAGTGPRICRLIGLWSPEQRAVVRYWITNLVDDRVERVIALSRLRRRSAADIAVMESDFGLRDFEGRSFRGWHHHMTMVSAAFAFAKLGWREDAWPGADQTGVALGNSSLARWAGECAGSA